MKTNIGVGDNSRKAISAKLAEVLASTYSLYLKTQNFHWNVTGEHFHSLHGLFGQQYEELIPVIDEVAERIRALGQAAPGSYKAFAGLSKIKDAPDTPPKALDMVKTLLEDHETLIGLLHETLKLAEENSDEVTVDLMVGRLDVHQKTAWMLRSTAS